MSYKIIRFYRDETPSKKMFEGLSLEEAQEHCSREDTYKEGVWFDGYAEE